MKTLRSYTSVILALLSLGVVSCSSSSDEEKSSKALIKGQITVSDSLERSGDFSNFRITIINRDSVGAKPDTLYDELTTQTGDFSGMASFKSKSYYPLLLSRNGENIARFSVILADNDTLSLSANLPDLEESLEVNSREHKAMEVYQRVDKGFQRVAALGRAGAIADSLMVDEITKWSDIYWDVWKEHKGTLASWFAVEKSAQLLRGIDNELMMDRIDNGLPADYVIGVAISYGKPYKLEKGGLEAGVNYLDSLMQVSESDDIRELVMRDKIELYFDSSDVKKAKDLLDDYERKYDESPSSKNWTERIRYDLNYLAPGLNVPEFEFATGGDTVTTESLKGSPYILEISPLANRTYLNDYDRTIVIYEIYKNYGLKIYTIPLDQSQVTVNGFFEERRKVWPVADIGSFDVQHIIEKFNVTQVPTRFLVNENGELVRKYVRDEFEDVIQDLNATLNNPNKES